MTNPLPPALFVAAHPDDETLAMCVPIAEHLRLGQDVHVLWLSGGDSSAARGRINGTASSPAPWWGVDHDPAVEGYSPLSNAEFAAARVREATVAVRCLAAGYPGTLTVHEAGLDDGTFTQAQAQAAIQAVCDAISPAGVRLKTHSWLVDDHADHIAAGAAVKAMAQAPQYADPRYYVLPPYWSDPRLSQVSEVWDAPVDQGVKLRCVNACRAFAAWSPPHTYAAGYHSVPSMFAQIDGNPRSMFHA